ncbi:helix-turn-helix transcriptional regulator, partial [Mangrovihabitans endophyticus]|uniref:helix-turn-helix transcriptional regulator n=1 Tax=Mangrovihabitans endophyticus TaxID=1751298 RepID=UPI001E343AB9
RIMLGVSSQRVYQITHSPRFPEPVARLSSGWVWLTDDIDQWIAQHRPHLVGNPRRDTPGCLP